MSDLKKALKEVCEAELDAEISAAQLQQDHNFSPKHTSQMQQCIAKHNSPISRFFAKTGVRVACVIMICAIVSVSAFQVEAIREPIKGFIIEKVIGEKSISYYDDEEAISSISEYYVLEDLPSEYELQFSQRTSSHMLNYYDDGISTIVFGQYVKSHYKDARIDDEDSVYEYTDKDGQLFLIIESSVDAVYLWDNGEYILHVVVPSSFTKEEAIALCKSAKPEKTQ